MSRSTPPSTGAWGKLRKHRETIARKTLRHLFAEDSPRFARFSLEACGLLLDYSKNLISEETLKLLLSLAEERRLLEWREKLFAGERINITENRAVLHWALRASRKIEFEGNNVSVAIEKVREHMRRFSDAIRSGTRTGFSGKPFQRVISIGIGGSDLGPLMVTEALRPYASSALDCRFVSNIDGAHLLSALENANAETTLFIVVSKTFTTQETLTNAKSARQWFLANGGTEAAIARHFVAVTTNGGEAAKFGIASNNVFEFWDWVGGRYSLWSAVGLAIALSIGWDNFNELLTGAREMDEHFENAPFERNLPVILALLNVWYTNFWGAQSRAVLPYDQTLSRFPAYLQQLEMESNGKRVTRDGGNVDYITSPVVWGEPGTNGQHAFFQLLHQGTIFIPVDFICAAQCRNDLVGHQTLLVANCFAQSEALMLGRTEAETREELRAKGLSGQALEKLLPHKVFPGNRPSNTIVFKRLTPKTLGSLIALYEHKVFVEGAVLDINSFDQWGVELGKELANRIVADLEGETGAHDSSTEGLLGYVKANR